MDTTDPVGAGIFGAMLGVMLVIYCSLLLFMIICLWKVYTKAGKPGWTSIIPIYNTIVMLEIVGRPVWWIFLLLIPIVNIYFAVKMIHGLSRSFGHDVGMTLLLIFLPIIAYPMLAFGSSQYKGPSGPAGAVATA